MIIARVNAGLERPAGRQAPGRPTLPAKLAMRRLQLCEKAPAFVRLSKPAARASELRPRCAGNWPCNAVSHAALRSRLMWAAYERTQKPSLRPAVSAQGWRRSDGRVAAYSRKGNRLVIDWRAPKHIAFAPQLTISALPEDREWVEREVMSKRVDGPVRTRAEFSARLSG